MKKLYFAIFALISGNTFCQTTIDFEDFNLSGSETYFDGSDMSGTSNGLGEFETYYSEGFLMFNSIYDTTWGVSSGYWSKGWAFTNETPDNLVGYAGLFSSYAGGGDASANYVIGQNGSRIMKSNAMVSFQTLQLTNNNYAASAMLNGDSFAKKFGGTTGDDPDWFLLTIVGYDAGDQPIDSIEFYLADYRFSNNAQDYILKDWTTVDLSAIDYALYIDFKLSSSDNSGGYMNTPAFFAVDKVTHSSAIGVTEMEEFTFNVSPNPAHDILFVNVSESAEQLWITNMSGQVVKDIMVNDL